MVYSFFNTIIKGYLKYRHTRIEQMYIRPIEVQQEVFQSLMLKLKATEYGKIFKTSHVHTLNEYKDAVPLVNYESLFPFIEKMMSGQENVLWPGKVQWYAKSSGTTNDRSKFIPISDENLFENHVAASWDAMAILYKNQPDSKIFDRKNLIMGGSLHHVNEKLITGDVSAILLDRMPAVGRPFYSPDFETALLTDWEEKIEKMAHQCINDDIVMFAGVPTWTIVLFKRILEITGKANMYEVWPNVKTYFHGGVGFAPYINQFKEFLPGNDLQYYEVYNASEGYFAVQDRTEAKGMLLLLDNAIYYEFIHLNHVNNDQPETLSLDKVEIGVDYEIIISTTSGLWRYRPGDVIQFVSLMPFRILVSGRTKQYINVFGEEVMVSNTDQALRDTCAVLGGRISDYTVAPIFMQGSDQGGHEWLIEFEESPKDLAQFAQLLDDKLRCINSDYDAKRFKDIALKSLSMHVLPQDTFHKWLRSKGKIGGQSKIPRLSNDRKFVEELIQFQKSNK